MYTIKYGDKVKVVGGFYRGQEGIAIEEIIVYSENMVLNKIEIQIGMQRTIEPNIWDKYLIKIEE